MELLTLESLKTAARNFCSELSVTQIHNLYGVTDAKAVGTYVSSGLRIGGRCDLFIRL